MANNIQIANLELQITSNSNTAVQGLDVLINKLEELKKVTAGSLGLTRIAKQFSNFNSAIQSLDISKLEKIRDTLTALRDLKRLNLVRVETPTGESTTQSPEITETATTTAEGIQAAQEDTDRLNDSAKAAGKSVKSLNKELSNNKGKGLAENTKKTTKELKNIKDPAKKASGAIGKFIKSLGRIAFYRAIRSALKSVVQAFKTGLQNLYQFDREVGGTFSKSLDSIASSTSTIKNSLGLIAAPIIESLAPALERTSELFLEFGNAVSKISAQINGKSTYTKAVRNIKEYQDSIEKAKNATQGFDELNIADSGKEDVSTMFEQVAVSDEITDTEKSLASLIGVIKNVVVLVKEKIYPVIKDLIIKIAPLLPPLLELITTILHELLSSIGDILQSGEFKEFIVNIANSIASVIKMVKSALPAIRKIIEIIAKVITEIVGALNYIIGDGIGKAENSTGVILTLVEGILNIVGKVLELLKPILDIVVRVVSIITTLVDTVLMAIQPVLEGIFDILQPIIDMVVDVLVSALQPIIPVLDIIITLLNDTLYPIIEKLGVFIKPLLEWVATAFSNLNPIITALAELVSTGLVKAFEGLKLVLDLVFAVFSGDVDKMKDAWSNLMTFMKNVWSNLWDGIKNIFVKMINGIIGGFEKFVNALIIAINWITDKLSSVWEWTGIPAIPKIPEVSFKRISYAQGGYGIPNGQLFIANEAGAELVGSMNNRTTVANNQQIVEGIKQGVIDAMLSVADFSNNDDKNINLAVYLDGRQIKAEMDRLTQSNGAKIATGGLAYYG